MERLMSEDKNDNWTDQFVDHMKNAPVEPKKRKPRRPPYEMFYEALKHFRSLDLPGVYIEPSSHEWVIWFTGNTKENKETLSAEGCRYFAQYQAWAFRASARLRVARVFKKERSPQRKRTHEIE